MKKIIIFIITVFTVLTLAACGNVSLGRGNYSFHGCHLQIGDLYRDVSVINWHDSEGAGVEIKTDDYGSIFASEGTYIMYEGAICPICGVE